MKAFCGKRGSGHLLLLCAVLATLLLSACSSRQGGGQSDMPALLIPENEDSEPLTSTEVAALKSTGQIDRNVPASAMPAVTAQYKHFLHKGRRTMEIFSQRSGNYLGYARRVFRSRGMPEELAYLAIVESGYRADAKSRAGAAGAWQFMPYTGMKYGLTQDWWMDERLDPYKATEAAADYLQKLYGDFRDWPTAIAAYNAGEGKMRRAKEGTGARNFYEVCERNARLDDKAQLRPETMQYVPRFVAISKIMRNLPQLGFTPVDQDKPAPVRRLTARPGTDLIALSRACGLSWESFQGYNLHHKRTISSTERSTFVYVPVQNEAQAQAFLRSSSASAFANWRPTKRPPTPKRRRSTPGIPCCCRVVCPCRLRPWPRRTGNPRGKSARPIGAGRNATGQNLRAASMCCGPTIRFTVWPGSSAFQSAICRPATISTTPASCRWASA